MEATPFISRPSHIDCPSQTISFSSTTTHCRDKIDTLIDFPLVDLDLRSVVKHNHWEVGQEPIYDCYAVSNHFGGLGGGHYTAYARRGNGGKQDKNGEGHGGEENNGSSSPWHIFDDSRVTTCVDESEVVSNAAYCLYYKRKDIVFDDDDYVVEDNERKIRMSKTTTPTKQQLGVNRPDGYEGREGGRSMKSEGGLVSMPVSPMHTTPRSSPQPPTPRCSFNDANTNDAAMEEAESCSSATSYVTPNTSLQAELDVYDEMMNELI